MKPQIEIELINIFQQNSFYRDKYDHNEIRVLLKEFVRRSIKCGHLINQKYPHISLKDSIPQDLAQVIMETKMDIPKLKDLPFSYFDKAMINAYFNWQQKERVWKVFNLKVSNPYTPVIEILKRGGHSIKYKHPSLEVDSLLRIDVLPHESFLNAKPFWSEEMNE